MYKKIIFIICLFFLLVGCSSKNINTLTLEEIIDDTIQSKDSYKENINNKGYRYYLPTEFTLHKDNDYVQELLSHNTIYYLNIDIISYYYKNTIETKRDQDDYEYYTFEYDDKKGYLKVTKNNDYFFVELCYNYAIIEVEVEESELRYAVSRSIAILNSIKYNDLIIEKYINDNNLENVETIYSIPEPENQDDKKNVLEYIEEGEYDSEDNY